MHKGLVAAVPGCPNGHKPNSSGCHSPRAQRSNPQAKARLHTYRRMHAHAHTHTHAKAHPLAHTRTHRCPHTHRHTHPPNAHVRTCGPVLALLQAVVRDVASKAMAPATALLDDRLYVFEAVGLLLGQEEVAAEQQSAALSALLQPLTSQVRNRPVSARTHLHTYLHMSTQVHFLHRPTKAHERKQAYT